MKYNTHNEVPLAYRWDLAPLFDGTDAWEKALAAFKEELPSLAGFKGRLQDKTALAEMFVLQDDLVLRYEQLYVYAYLRLYEDMRVGSTQQMAARIAALGADLGAISAYTTPEISEAYSKEQLLALAEEPAFLAHKHELQELARQKDRVLSEKEETLLAQLSPVVESFQEIFGKFDNADIRWDDVKVGRKKVKLSHGVYGELMQSPVREVRKAAHYSMMTGYKRMINTIAATYAGNVQADVFFAKARGYRSVLERALDADNVPVGVYQNLLDAVHEAIPTLRRYMRYRKKQLCIAQHKAYDMYAVTETASDKKYEFEESFALVKEGLAPLGEDYVALLQKAKDERWIDVYETQGKRSGGFSWGVYGSPAYILLNYNGTLNETFTIAHELGHSMHTYFSDNALPYAAAQYRIFVAEIASTVNEMLLIKSMLGKAQGAMRRYLLCYLLDMFKSTVFRQTLFAEFEMKAHEAVEKGEGLSPDSLCQMYQDLIQTYYGKEFVTSVIRYEWARIPHFYSSFYVYKYATGLISACAIATDIIEGKEGAVAAYKRFLSAGGSMDPLDILKLAGVDLTDKAPFEKAMRYFADALAELESAQ